MKVGRDWVNNMRREMLLVIFLLSIFQIYAREEERTFLDKLAPLFRIFKKPSNDALRRITDSPRSRKLLRRNNRRLTVPRNMEFPCDVNVNSRSPVSPKSAHEVRPGDIDVVGALGDSLSAGFGASANTLVEVLSENRGRAFSIGGQGTWKTSLTLPNILKVFNPKLIGYSLRTSLTLDNESQFNVAEGGAISANMPYMAKALVDRIKTDSRVDVGKDWKMITLLVGDNDFCLEMCYYKNPEDILDKHKQDLLDVLRILKSNLPRTLVNIIPPIHLKLLVAMENKPPLCVITHLFECPCIINKYRFNEKKFYDIMGKWQELDIEVSNYPEFDLDDFTVIPHNFTLEQKLPKNSQGGTDYTYFSADCFHFSEKGHALVANNLWNSLLEPFGNKSTSTSDPFVKFMCPTKEYPYIFTRRNSP